MQKYLQKVNMYRVEKMTRVYNQSQKHNASPYCNWNFVLTRRIFLIVLFFFLTHYLLYNRFDSLIVSFTWKHTVWFKSNKSFVKIRAYSFCKCAEIRFLIIYANKFNIFVLFFTGIWNGSFVTTTIPTEHFTIGYIKTIKLSKHHERAG